MMGAREVSESASESGEKTQKTGELEVFRVEVPKGGESSIVK